MTNKDQERKFLEFVAEFCSRFELACERCLQNCSDNLLESIRSRNWIIVVMILRRLPRNQGVEIIKEIFTGNRAIIGMVINWLWPIDSYPRLTEEQIIEAGYDYVCKYYDISRDAIRISLVTQSGLNSIYENDLSD